MVRAKRQIFNTPKILSFNARKGHPMLQARQSSTNAAGNMTVNWTSSIPTTTGSSATANTAMNAKTSRGSATASTSTYTANITLTEVRVCRIF